jgi:thymidine kinase
MNTELNGQLDIILGTMFSGKTTYLLSKMAKLAELNYSILYINIEFHILLYVQYLELLTPFQ